MNKEYHLVLYAKGWYQKSDNKINDLKVICGNIASYDAEYVSEKDIVYWLQDCTKTWFAKNPQRFYDLIESWRKGENIIDSFLSFIRIMPVDAFEFEIGNPDENILPLHKHTMIDSNMKVVEQKSV